MTLVLCCRFEKTLFKQHEKMENVDSKMAVHTNEYITKPTHSVKLRLVAQCTLIHFLKIISGDGFNTVF